MNTHFDVIGRKMRDMYEGGSSILDIIAEVHRIYETKYYQAINTTACFHHAFKIGLKDGLDAIGACFPQGVTPIDYDNFGKELCIDYERVKALIEQKRPIWSASLQRLDDSAENDSNLDSGSGEIGNARES